MRTSAYRSNNTVDTLSLDAQDPYQEGEGAHAHRKETGQDQLTF
jgi:hypothetical protein